MDITVYLPDEIGQWAKEKKLNLSGMLRDAVEQRRREDEETARTLATVGVRTIKLSIDDNDGNYTLRFDGVPLVESRGSVEVYLVDDERVLVYDSNKEQYSEVEDPESELRDWLDDDEYIEAMNSLGISPEVDLPERDAYR